jgi:asparagine synthase (glutamine-hydrolysing)
MDINLSGWDGGTVMGHPDCIEPLQCDPFSDEAFLTHQFNLFNQKFTWPGLMEAEERLLYTDNISKKVTGLAFDSFRDELAPYMAFRRDVRSEYFNLVQHCNRMTQNMVIFGRSHIEQRFPFFDYDLFNFLYSIPAYHRADRMLYRAVIQKEIHELAYIPYDHDELPPTTDKLARGIVSTKNRLQSAVHRHIIPIFPVHQTLYADYEEYLRNELRPWAEGILFDQRVVEHGIFMPSFLKTLMGRHVSGRELWTIGKIAPILTYEMILRRFYD